MFRTAPKMEQDTNKPSPTEYMTTLQWYTTSIMANKWMFEGPSTYFKLKP